MCNLEMLEWCYQWDNHDEFVDKYYKSLELKEKAKIKKTESSLAENLWKEVKISKEEKPFHKKADARDALYFIDL